MLAYEIEDLIKQLDWPAQRYLEALRKPALSLGIYKLPAGGVDSQQPHSEDEVYYVLAGRASIQVGDETRKVRAGSLVYVEAKMSHHFFDIQDDLTALVVFCPAEHTKLGG